MPASRRWRGTGWKPVLLNVKWDNLRLTFDAVVVRIGSTRSRMSSVRQILTATEKLTPDEFLKVQTRMNRIAERLWTAEHRRATGRFQKSGKTDDDIDRFVSKRRLKSRRP